MKQRYKQLALIDEKRTMAQYHSQGYQKRIAKAFNKKVRPRNHKEGDLVLKVLRDETFDPRGKMKPRWSRPFYYHEDHVRRCYENHRFGWERDALPNHHR